LRTDERRRSISERVEIESRNEGSGDKEMSATNDPRKSGARSSGSRRDETAHQALERAIGHASVALSEGVASARALLDAASLIVSELPAEAQPNLAELARALDQVSEALSGNSPSLRAAATHTLLETIDSEIARWEVKSRSDDDARSVLRVFMSLREVLWEIGIRREAPAPGAQGQEGAKGQTGWTRKDLKRAMSNLAASPAPIPINTATTTTTTTTTPTRAPKPQAKPTAGRARRIQRIKIEG
jgi:hypothetical protein